MTVFRTFDPSTHNRIANIPSVRKTIGEHIPSNDPVDFSDSALDALNWILLTDGKHAAAVFEIRGPVVLDGHIMFGPECRGSKALAVGREMLDWIFKNTKTEIITAALPVSNMAARVFLNHLGFTADGLRLVSNQYWTKTHAWFHMTRADYER